MELVSSGDPVTPTSEDIRTESVPDNDTLIRETHRMVTEMHEMFMSFGSMFGGAMPAAPGLSAINMLIKAHD